MKNTAWLFLAIVCISAMFISQALASEAAADVKKTHWKMSKAQVKRSIQKKPIKEEASFLIYQYAIFDSSCFVFYNFAPPGEYLAEVSYIFKPISQSHAGYIYSQLSAQIVKEYLRVHDPKATRFLSSKVLKFEDGITSVTLANSYKENGTVSVIYVDRDNAEKKADPASKGK